MNNKLFLKGFFKKRFFWFLLSTITVILVGFFRMYGVTYLNKAIGVVESGVFTGLWGYILLASLIQGLFYFFRWVVAVICRYLTESCAFELRLELLRHLNKISFLDFEKLGSGNVQATLRGDVDEAALIMYSLFSRVLTNSFMVLFNLIYMIYIDWKIGLLVLVLSLLMGFINLKMNIPAKHYQVAAKNAKGEIANHLVNTTKSFDSIKFYEATPFLLSLYRKPRKIYDINTLKTVDIRSLREDSITLITNIATFTGILVIGFGVARGQNTIGDLVILTSLMTQVLTPMGILFRWMPSLIQSTTSWHRVEKIFKLPLEKPAKSLETDDISQVEFTDLSFSYDNGQGVNLPQLVFQRGKIYTLTGESGSGKSTVLKLISCIYHSDTVRVTINGKTAPQSALYGKIAYLPPNPQLFSMSLYDNLTMGETIAKEECFRCLERLGMGDWLSELAEGLDYEIDENSSNLSGGQKQLISIARAILLNRPVLILDEPFSALDNDKEKFLIEVLKEISDNKIILFTSHRESSLHFGNETIAL